MPDILIIAGFACICLSFIWLLIIAFGSSIWWGLAILLLPGAPPIFLVLNLKDTFNPLALLVVGLLAELGGHAMGGTSPYNLGYMDVLIIVIGGGTGYLAKTMGFLSMILPP